MLWFSSHCLILSVFDDHTSFSWALQKDRIKAQFMKELEVLSKKYEAMLQEEDSKYTSKVSSLEVNLKKVEMNRRLAEVFRIKNSMDTVPASAG